MKNSNKTKITQIFIALLLFISLPMASIGQEIIEIQVAPNVLNLQSQSQVVTIHTDVPFSQVDGSTVTLNDQEVDSWKSDNNGDFVAKFAMESIKDLDLLINEYNTMVLIGLKADGTEFRGEDEVLVIDKKGKK